MNIAILTKWGNSAGIRIPASDLKAAKAYIGEQFKVSVSPAGGFNLLPIKDPQTGWTEAFNTAADAGHDKLLMQDFDNEFDKDEWQW